MPRVEREAQVVWEGSSARGRGSLSAASSGAFSGLPFSEPARVGDPDGQTSPEELIAAAHAGCYAMSLAAELTRMRTPPERLEVRAVVVLDEVGDEGHRIVESRLEVAGRASGASEDDFHEAVRLADKGCPVSALVRGSAKVKIATMFEEA